jgi:hypothetical protein
VARSALAAAALAAWLVLASGAGAAPTRFVLEYCDPALPQTSDPWMTYSVTPAEGVPVRWFNDCLKPGGSIGIQEVGDSGDASAALSVSVPPTPGGYVESVTMIGGTAALGGSNTGTYIYEPDWPFPNGGEDLRVFRVRGAPPASGYGGGDFQVRWGCSGAIGSCVGGPIVYARDIAVTEVDTVAPAISAGGELLSGAVARGVEAVEATATDEGGGISRVEVLANGLPAAPATIPACAAVKVADPAYEGLAALTPSPCPAKVFGSWQVDTAAYPFRDGANTVSVCASDFATTGVPDTSCSPPRTLLVDNSCAESSVGGGASLDATFAEGSSESLTVGYGEGAEIRGTLASASGAAIPGATICVQSATEGDAGPAPAATARTDASGAFQFGVVPGPDRRILVGYRHGSFQLDRTLTVRSHVRPSLAVRPRKLRDGRQVRLGGRLPGPDAGGRVVVLQANVVGSRRWITFRRATTDAHGYFSSGYRFHSTTHKTDYRFRAVVPRQDHYPYVEGRSKPVVVVVRR